MTDDTATVLIVEDERALVDLFSNWLSDDFDVRTAYDGEQALAKIDDEVDVVLLDRRMPGLSGDDVLERVRERDIDATLAEFEDSDFAAAFRDLGRDGDEE
ncbi:response regulator [Salinirarus marinus]|uniref:response regulator n=1 Tax=Salinirarus marinus TaxID=3068310 RepID=UPI003C6C75B7